MSAIEEAIKRIEHSKNVQAFVIVDDKGNVLRHRRDMSEATAKSLASALWKLTSRAQHTVRDIDPTDRLNFFRLRMEKIEVLVAPGPGYMVIVSQEWTPAAWAQES